MLNRSQSIKSARRTSGCLQVDLLAQWLPEQVSLSLWRLRTHPNLAGICRIAAPICRFPAIPATAF
uniref:Uncharacterized protein n=1 Tax=blood disease bacterium R229 TaxID=741978 RepID=G2ZQS7_9RALS|nr:hypothetical protein BDB_140007 [blood disease bacterium R229]